MRDGIQYRLYKRDIHTSWFLLNVSVVPVGIIFQEKCTFFTFYLHGSEKSSNFAPAFEKEPITNSTRGIIKLRRRVCTRIEHFRKQLVH